MALVIGLRAYFVVFVPEPPTRNTVLANIQLMQPRVDASVNAQLPPPNDARLTGTRLDHVLESGVLRINQFEAARSLILEAHG